MKISIVGLPGSGKTVLARRIHTKLGIPHIELDRFWLAAGGETLPKGESPAREKVRAYVREKAEEGIAGEAWVSDGFYNRLQPTIADRADIVVFLDIPLTQRIWNHLWRVFTTSRHPEISLFHDFWFVFELIRRTYRTGPKIAVFIKTYSRKAIILRSRGEIECFLVSLSPVENLK